MRTHKQEITYDMGRYRKQCQLTVLVPNCRRVRFWRFRRQSNIQLGVYTFALLAQYSDMTLNEVRAHRDIILGIASRHGARNIRVFGSTARGTATRSSDVDLLVDLEPGRTLLDLGGLLMDVQSATGLRVDVAMERMLRPDARAQALEEAVPL